MVKRNQPELALKTLKDWIDKSQIEKKTLLLSGEFLYTIPKWLFQATRPYRVKIIGFFRDPLDFIYSDYNQTVKNVFNTLTIDQHCQRIVNNINYKYQSDIAKQWTTLFGVEHIVFLAYDQTVLKSYNIQRLFLSTLGLLANYEQFSCPSKQFNPSYAPEALELKRIMNIILDKEDKKTNRHLDWFLQHYSEHSAEVHPERKYKQRKYKLNDVISVELYQSLSDKFAQKTQELIENYLTTISPLYTSLSANKDVTPEKRYIDHRLILANMIVLTEKILQEKPALYQLIRDRLIKYLSEHHHEVNCHLFKLAELMNITVRWH